MIEQVLPDLYRMEIPLPKNPLKALNSYVIKTADRFLIIDTGMNREECKRAMSEGLRELDIDLAKTDFFITHLHADHEGLVGTLASPTSIVYFSELELNIVKINKTDQRWHSLKQFALANGAQEKDVQIALQNHPGRIYSSDRKINYKLLKNNDVLRFGDYSFTCIETPGHTPHHMCLYEPNKKILVAGDHLLINITPNITHWPEMDNSLQQYLESLDKIYDLDVSLVLPGHRSIWNDHRSRIRELREHHNARLQEVLAALQNGAKSAYDIAPYIKWDIIAKSWEHFPSVQKWFALGETIAHIEYLESKGLINRTIQDGKIMFSLPH